MSQSSVDGLLVIDKPPGITSRDAVNIVQSALTFPARVGHTGTLDPLASGVLVLCIGAATRLAEYVQAMDKVYRSTILFGARSETDDTDGKITLVEGVAPVEISRVLAALAGFVGEVEQRPPAYSALKVAGRRAYARLRRGESLELAARRVRIHCIEIRRYDWPRLEVEVRCGKGTYIRALARDLGDALGCGGLIEALRRMRVGPFHVDDAVSVDAVSKGGIPGLRPIADAVAHLQRIDVDEGTAGRIAHGQAVPCSREGEIAVFCKDRLIAIGRAERDPDLLRPLKVLNAAE